MNSTTHIPAATAALSGAICGAAINRKVRRLLLQFRVAGATDHEHAVTLQALGVFPSWIFDRLARGGVFVAVPDGRYYLDEAAAARRQRRRRVVALGVLCIVLLSLWSLWYSGLLRF